MIFFIEAPLSGSGLSALTWALDHGVAAALVTTDPAKYRKVPGSEAIERLAEAGALHVVSTTEGEHVPEELITAASAADEELVGVVCLLDRHLLFAAALAERIGAPFASIDTVRTIRDKRLARTMYERLGIASPRWTAPRDEAEFVAFMAEVGGPVVLKNCRGTGSLDVVLCRPEQGGAAFARMTEADRYLDGALMAEEYLRGPLYSLETLVTDDGRAHHLGFTDRQLGPAPTFCEVSYTFPVEVPEAPARDMREAVDKIVRECAIPQGMLHTEFVLTKNGAVIVEVNARPGGGLLPLMMDDCLTVPLPELLCAAALGQSLPEVAANGRHSSTVTVYAPARGQIRRVGGLEHAATQGYVTQVVTGAGAGDEARTAQDYRGAVCQIRTLGDTPGIAFNAALSTAREIEIDVELPNGVTV
ncbi:ATP-grasp domain-containing protein [Streptomyces sp. NPDC059456]|uniref:ATP-grasp domain-containing protein n=1 Tax=Streptomyces sp. NPDC059456 TaxID=3346838 RepID=UPI00368EAB9D